MARKTDAFYSDMQRYIAATTVDASALRNQGGTDVIEEVQCFLAALDIGRFSVTDEPAFLTSLETATGELQRRLPTDCQHWGAARKALNIFLRDICYNRFLSQKYSLVPLEPWMELPLDSLVASAVKRHVGRGRLPIWPGLKGLTPPVSLQFQRAAKEWADTEGISRIHLDMRIWVEERTKLAEKALRARQAAGRTAPD